MPFLNSPWCVAAWDDEIAAGSSLRRRILDQDILLLRGSDGKVHALRNRCPHRFAPLSLGTRIDDSIRCAYHGLQFDLNGRCIHNPHDDGAIPERTTARSYPLVLRQSLLWIWMGEAPGVHLMTPETEQSTHYFWSNARDFRKDDAVLHAQLQEGLQYAFEQQDKPMILAQRDAMEAEDFWDLKPVVLPGDTGAIRARIVLRKLIKDEQSGSSNP
jgi:nitrite reductase/ring-hydroxylating ferredoxin subunit